MVNVMAHSTSNWPHLSMIFPYTLQSVFNLISVSYLLVRCAFLEGHRKDLEELYTSMLLLQESAPVFPKSTHSVPQVPAQPSQRITTIKKKKKTMMLLMTQTSQTEHSNVLDSIQPLALPRVPKPSEHLSRSQKACPLPD